MGITNKDVLKTVLKVPQLETQMDNIEQKKAEKCDYDDIVTLSKYYKNLKTDSYWNESTPTKNYLGRNIVLIGDSHMWGQGSPNFQGFSSGSNIHCPWIHNDGFGDRIKRYIYSKWNSQPVRVIPSAKAYNYTLDGAFCEVSDDYKKYDYDEYLYTDILKIVNAKYNLGDIVGSEFCGAKAKNDSFAIDNYKYNAEVGFFTKTLLGFKPNSNGKSCIIADIKTPTSIAVVNVVGGNNCGKLKIELLDINDNANAVVDTFGSYYYGNETPVVYEGVNGYINNVPSTKAVITNSKIIIDTSSFSNEINFIIDFKQKKKGRVRLSHDLIEDKPINTRGVLLGNLDMVKNWSFGSHTMGAWLGQEGSYGDSSLRNHINDIMGYMYLPLRLIIMEVPIVNEYLFQTSISKFKERLSKVAFDSLLSYGGNAKIIVFNTIGGKIEEFTKDTSNVTYEMYNNALNEWVEENKNVVTFVNCRSHLKKMVDIKAIKYSDLYTDNFHPSPLVNEIIFDMLKKAIDINL